MSTSSAASPAVRPLILIASPSVDEHEMYGDYFAFFGFRVATATNGHEAIDVALAQSPAVVVASMHLPGRDGIDVCRALGAAMIPVVLLASAPLHGKSGCATVLLRPAFPHDVMAAIEHVLAAE
jgi:CheY-like chemotaxis protein